MTDRIRLSYNDVLLNVKSLALEVKRTMEQGTLQIDSVYGVPRGGVPVAIMLAQELGLPVVEHPKYPTSLIVDDLADSGATLRPFASDYVTAVLIHKKHSKVQPTFASMRLETSSWFEFPWEGQEAPAEDAVVRLLQSIGEDTDRDGLRDTPKRVVKSYRDLFAGYAMDPKKVLGTQFESDGRNDEVIICKDIEMYSTCEHHMLPFFGKASVGYIPGEGGKIVGLSKLARVVEVYSRRLQNQERITHQVALAIQEVLSARAVGVVIEADHFCMRARGVNKQNSKMVTSCMMGLFRTDPMARSEFLRLLGK